MLSDNLAVGFGTKGKGRNSKTGDTANTYRPVGDTCPDECPLKRAGKCYAKTTYTVNLQQRRSASETFDVASWIGALSAGKLVRHMVSGDWFRNDGTELDTAYVAGAKAGHAARPDTPGYSYTHGWRRFGPAALNGKGLVVNASTETSDDTRRALAAGWDVAQIVAPDAPKVTDNGDHMTVVCPQQSTGGKVTCDQCRLCAKPQRQIRGKPLVIGFRAHSAPNAVMALIGGTGEPAAMAAD